MYRSFAFVCVCAPIHAVPVEVRIVGSPGAGVIYDCQPSRWCWELNLGTLEELSGHLTSWALQTSLYFKKNCILISKDELCVYGFQIVPTNNTSFLAGLNYVCLSSPVHLQKAFMYISSSHDNVMAYNTFVLDKFRHPDPKLGPCCRKKQRETKNITNILELVFSGNHGTLVGRAPA